MLEFLYQGGPVMIPILLCSVLSLAFTFERVWYLWKVRVPEEAFWADVEPALERHDYERALDNVNRFEGALADVVRAGLTVEPLTYDRASEQMEETGVESVPRLEKFLPALNFIAQVAPLLGLLGTVAGMIQTFSVIAQEGVGRPNLLAGGISEALITTASGLTVGIITLFFHHLLTRRVDDLLHQIEMAVRKVEAILKEDPEMASPGEAEVASRV